MSDINLSDQDIENILRLVDGQRQPVTGMEVHFLRVMRGEATPCSPVESRWYELCVSKGSGRQSATELLHLEQLKIENAALIAARNRTEIRGKEELERLATIVVSRDALITDLERAAIKREDLLKVCQTRISELENRLGINNNREKSSNTYGNVATDQLHQSCEACGRTLQFCRCSN